MQLFLSLFQLISNITPIMNIFVTLKTNNLNQFANKCTYLHIHVIMHSLHAAQLQLYNCYLRIHIKILDGY